jgi:hypothetical protein
VADKLTTGASTDDATGYTTAPITPGPDRLVVAFVVNTAAFFQPAGAVPALSGNGLTWEVIDSIQMGERRLSCFIGRAAVPSAGAVSITYGNVTQTLCAWSIFEYEAVPGTAKGAIRAHQAEAPRSASAMTVTQNPGLGPNEVAVGGLMLDVGQAVTAGGGCVQIDTQAPTQPFAPAATLHTEDRTTPGDLSWAWPNPANAAAIVLSVKLPTPVGPQPVDPVESLIRKFEPILFFDAAEGSYPSDAKRYLEHCALWKAAKPYDKASWSKLVPAGQLSGTAAEPGKSIGDAPNSVDTPVEERFLELGGWLSRSGTAQPTVVGAPTANVYANRAEIRARYANVGALRDSQFWYHAELFDTQRLRSLAESVQHPELYKMLQSTQNPALICYYLFFPEHEQAVVGASLTATEVGGYAGQWACVAVLLGRRDPQDEYTVPNYIGFTGSPTIPPSSHAFDSERRITIKVAEWTPALPVTTDGHPHLHVSRGTHSLYLDNAPHAVDPFPTTPPVDEGTSDGQYTEVLDNPDVAIFLVKILSGPIGWVAAGIEALTRDVNMGIETGLAGTPDKVPDDTATKPGGVTVHPAGMAPRPEWTKPQAWRSAQAQLINGRQYDFIVDRATQPWWPSDNGRSGFRGRWGQRVDVDRLPRRSGVRFPEFWRLFLLALEDGRQRGLLPKK